MQPDTYYHIYNRANGSENLYRSNENYRYFLRQYAKYIEPIADTYAYCLMPNHFHFLVKIKSFLELDRWVETEEPSKSSKPLEGLLSLQFSHLFNSYTQAFNRQHGRKGSLFSPNFKRKEIDSDEYLLKVIHYIHHNPVHHGFVNELSNWPFSSYNSVILNKPTLVRREEVIALFDNIDNFIYCHSHPPASTDIDFN